MTNIQLLEKAIEKILSVYNSISVKWFEYKSGKLYNQSKILVKQISRDSEYFIDIKDYTKFLCNEKIHEMEFGLKNNIINRTRIKQDSSISYKLYRYERKQVEGKSGTIQVNKCFNDLFGLRIIFKDNIQFKDIKELVNEKFKHLKCNNSSKNGYKATHIYFRTNDKKHNYYYQWELQIWNASDEANNYISHEKLKQGYTIWENNILKSKEGK